MLLVPNLSQINPALVLVKDLFKVYFNIIIPSVRSFYKWTLSLIFPHQDTVCISPLPHICHMHSPSHSSCIDHRDGFWWCLQVTKLFTVQVSPFPCYFDSLRSKYLPQRLIPKYIQPTFFPQRESSISQPCTFLVIMLPDTFSCWYAHCGSQA